MNTQKNSLVSKLQIDFPDLSFVESDDFRWSPENNTIFYKSDTSNDGLNSLLHELAHALLHHKDYNKDIDLIKMEAQAWALVRDDLAGKYGVIYDEDMAQDDLDTYRNWLHKRSLCPNCQTNGVQIDANLYKCAICQTKWKVNSAKFVRLKRVKTKK